MAGVGLPEMWRTAVGVRRAKMVLSSGCRHLLTNAPAGGNRGSYGGNEMAEAFVTLSFVRSNSIDLSQ